MSRIKCAHLLYLLTFCESVLFYRSTIVRNYESWYFCTKHSATHTELVSFCGGNYTAALVAILLRCMGFFPLPLSLTVVPVMFSAQREREREREGIRTNSEFGKELKKVLKTCCGVVYASMRFVHLTHFTHFLCWLALPGQPGVWVTACKVACLRVGVCACEGVTIMLSCMSPCLLVCLSVVMLLAKINSRTFLSHFSEKKVRNISVYNRIRHCGNLKHLDISPDTARIDEEGA